MKIEVPNLSGELKPSPNLKLTAKEGNFVKGTLMRRFESKLYAGRFSYLVKVDDLQGDTVLWNKATESENNVDVNIGETVFVKGTTYLDIQMKQVQDGSQVIITYTGKGKAKKGQKAPFQYDVEVI